MPFYHDRKNSTTESRKTRSMAATELPNRVSSESAHGPIVVASSDAVFCLITMLGA